MAGWLCRLSDWLAAQTRGPRRTRRRRPAITGARVINGTRDGAASTTGTGITANDWQGPAGQSGPAGWGPWGPPLWAPPQPPPPPWAPGAQLMWNPTARVWGFSEPHPMTRDYRVQRLGPSRSRWAGATPVAGTTVFGLRSNQTSALAGSWLRICESTAAWSSSCSTARAKK